MSEAAFKDRIDPHVWRIATVVVLGSIMSILDTTIVNVALDTLGRDLNARSRQIQWVLTGYMLALAAVIPVTGWAARRFGAATCYLLSLVLFTAGSALCGLATSTNQLIVFRVLQGFGGGMLLPIGQMMLASAAGPKRMGRVMSVVAIPAMLAPIFGPTIGGVIVDNLSWRWIFFVNIPIGIVAFVGRLRILPRGARAPGATRSTSAVSCCWPRACRCSRTGSPRSAQPADRSAARHRAPGPGIVLIAAFVFHALRVPRPLLDLHLYRRATFASASIAMFCLGAALFGGMILLPLYWQQVAVRERRSTRAPDRADGPRDGGRHADRRPAHRPLRRRADGADRRHRDDARHDPVRDDRRAHVDPRAVRLAMFVRGMGVGFAFMPAMTAAFAALKRSELADAAPQLNVVQRVGGSIGTAVLAVVLQRALVGAHTLSRRPRPTARRSGGRSRITAAAIVPCIVLTFAERAARHAADPAPIPTSAQLAESVA